MAPTQAAGRRSGPGYRVHVQWNVGSHMRSSRPSVRRSGHLAGIVAWVLLGGAVHLAPVVTRLLVNVELAVVIGVVPARQQTSLMTP